MAVFKSIIVIWLDILLTTVAAVHLNPKLVVKTKLITIKGAKKQNMNYPGAIPSSPYQWPLYAADAQNCCQPYGISTPYPLPSQPSCCQFPDPQACCESLKPATSVQVHVPGGQDYTIAMDLDNESGHDSSRSDKQQNSKSNSNLDSLSRSENDSGSGSGDVMPTNNSSVNATGEDMIGSGEGSPEYVTPSVQSTVSSSVTPTSSSSDKDSPLPTQSTTGTTGPESTIPQNAFTGQQGNKTINILTKLVKILTGAINQAKAAQPSNQNKVNSGEDQNKTSPRLDSTKQGENGFISIKLNHENTENDGDIKQKMGVKLEQHTLIKKQTSKDGTNFHRKNSSKLSEHSKGNHKLHDNPCVQGPQYQSSCGQGTAASTQINTLYPQETSPPCPQAQPIPCPQAQPIPCPQEQPIPCPQAQPIPCPQEQPIPCPQPQQSPCPQAQPIPCPQEPPSPYPQELSSCAPETNNPCTEAPPVTPSCRQENNTNSTAGEKTAFKEGSKQGINQGEKGENVQGGGGKISTNGHNQGERGEGGGKPPSTGQGQNQGGSQHGGGGKPPSTTEQGQNQGGLQGKGGEGGGKPGQLVQGGSQGEEQGGGKHPSTNGQGQNQGGSQGAEQGGGKHPSTTGQGQNQGGSQGAEQGGGKHPSTGQGQNLGGSQGGSQGAEQGGGKHPSAVQGGGKHPSTTGQGQNQGGSQGGSQGEEQGGGKHPSAGQGQNQGGSQGEVQGGGKHPSTTGQGQNQGGSQGAEQGGGKHPSTGQGQNQGGSQGGSQGEEQGGGKHPSAGQGQNQGGSQGEGGSQPGQLVQGQHQGSQNHGNQPATGNKGSCRRQALQEHNAKRAQHQAPPLQLNAALNQGALNYAKQLASSWTGMLKHSPDGTRPGQGENLAIACSKPARPYDCKVITERWYNEISQYNWNAPGFSMATGHFTQVVWKNSKQLGIGRAEFVNQRGMTCHLIVARYKPSGNVRGQFQQNVLN